MKKTVWIYGLISGGICSGLMIAAIPFENQIGYDRALVVGYTTMVLAFLLVFFGIRSYREHQGEGHITFLRAFSVGILITLVCCICYVFTWEVVYFKFMPDYMDKYGAHLVEKAKAAGASAAAIQAQTEQLKKYKEMYDNPLINAAMTFIEPFPVGAVMTLISALLLRKKAPAAA